MKIKYSEPERIEIDSRVAHSCLGMPYLKTIYVDVIDAEIKIRCNAERWKRDGKLFSELMEISIENDYPEADFHQAREMDFNESIRYEGDYAFVTISFVNGDKY